MRVVAIATGLLSAFFAFYTVRLLVVTQALQHTRPGGHGAYIGAVVFPVLAIALGWASVQSWRRATRVGPA